MGNPTLGTMVDRITGLCAPGRSVVVAIDGPAGSGKSTLADRLAAAVTARPGPPSLTLVRMDDLYPGWDGLAEAVPTLVDSILRPLSAGSAAGYRRYDWIAGEFAERHEVPATDVVIVEGVGSGAAAAAPQVDLLIWIEAPPDIRHTRGIARDGEAFAPHWERWAAQEDRLFTRDRTRDRADLVLDGASEIAER